MVEQWIKEIKESANADELGMLLVHNGVVRATSKDGKPVKGMRLTFNKGLLASVLEEAKKREGIADIRVWINEGELKTGDDIMYVLVAGRFRTDVLPALQDLLTKIKGEIVSEEEVPV